jgi:hypothetical protein
MQIKTKFSLGQKVYPIVKSGEEKTETCPLCKGTGKVALAGAEYRTLSCPDCWGLGHRNTCTPLRWHILKGNTTIGQMRVELSYAPDGSRKKTEQYMLCCTGVGSGQLWTEDLFATEEEAQRKCDLRNKAKTKKNGSRKSN